MLHTSHVSSPGRFKRVTRLPEDQAKLPAEIREERTAFRPV